MESIFKLGVIVSLYDMLSNPVKGMGINVDGLKGKIDALHAKSLAWAKWGAGVAGAGVMIAQGLLAPVHAAEATEKALGELRSVGVANLQAVAQAGLEFSNHFSGTTRADFVGAAYDIKSGISTLSDEAVAEFTKLAALTGKATKSSTAEMTSLFATGYGIYKDMYGKMSDMDFGRMFSGGLAASVQAFKTTGSGMAQAISTLGASATTANRPLEEQLSILGMLQATMSGSEAGTKYKAFMMAAAKAGEKIGISLTGADGQLLGMRDILQKLRGSFGDTLDAAEKVKLQEAFGTQEAVAVIDLFYNKVDDLTGNIGNLKQALQGGTSLTDQMAAAMNQDIGAGFDILGNRFQNLLEILGKQIIPVVAPVLAFISNAVLRLQEFASAHEGAVRVLAVLAGALAAVMVLGGGLFAFLGTAGMLLPHLISGYFNLAASIKSAKSATLDYIGTGRKWIAMQYRQLTASIAAAGGIRAYSLAMLSNLMPTLYGAAAATWRFTAALLANPLTWIVIAVLGVGYALYKLYAHFDRVKAGFDRSA